LFSSSLLDILAKEEGYFCLWLINQEAETQGTKTKSKKVESRFSQNRLFYFHLHFSNIIRTIIGKSEDKNSYLYLSINKETQSAGNQRPKSLRNISSLVGSSETTRATHFNSQFCQWLAGVIDGDGCLLVSKAGYTSCEITMGLSDLSCLKYIQNKIGGSIKSRSGVRAYRWRLHDRKGMIDLVNSINGHIRHSNRLVQLHRVCSVLNIEPSKPGKLDNTNAWFAGFFDADGSITLNTSNTYPQITISVTNKHLMDVQPFIDCFEGSIYFDTAQNGYYKWAVQSKKDLEKMYNYFKLCPIRSYKLHRSHLIPRFFDLYNLQAFKPDSDYYPAWQNFESKWNSKI